MVDLQEAGATGAVIRRRGGRSAPSAANPDAASARHELEAQILAAQLEERERLGAELHDSVGQTLVCIGLQLGLLRRAIAEGRDPGPAVEQISADVQQAHHEIRVLSHLLNPPWLEQPGGFEAALREFVEGFARRAGLAVRVELTGAPFGLTAARQLVIFRILQEALVNVHRHAGASQVQVRLVRAARRLSLAVQDDGHGVEAAEGVPPQLGVGLLSMRRRARALGGDLALVSSPGGTTVVAKWAVDGDEAATPVRFS